MNDKLSAYDLMRFMNSKFNYQYDKTVGQYKADGRVIDENMVNHILAYIEHNLDPSITRSRLLVGIKRNGDCPFKGYDDNGMDGAEVHSPVPTSDHRLIKDHVKPYDSTVNNDSGTLTFMDATGLKKHILGKYRWLDLSTRAIDKIIKDDLGYPSKQNSAGTSGYWLGLQGFEIDEDDEDKPEIQTNREAVEF